MRDGTEGKGEVVEGEPDGGERSRGERRTVRVEEAAWVQGKAGKAREGERSQGESRRGAADRKRTEGGAGVSFEPAELCQVRNRPRPMATPSPPPPPRVPALPPRRDSRPSSLSLSSDPADVPSAYPRVRRRRRRRRGVLWKF